MRISVLIRRMNRSAAVAVVAGSFLFGTVNAEKNWSLPVCATPGNLPASGRESPGYDNKIAEIIADELGAELSYVWTRFDNLALRDTLHAGECDLVIGVTEDSGGMITSIPYLRAPYVFIYLQDSNIDISSLDDPQLATVKIGTYQTGLPAIALRERGLQDNVIELAAEVTAFGLDRDNPIIDAVLDGLVDVGILYGPPADYRASIEDIPLVIVPVKPEIDTTAALLQHFRILAVGVRPHDDAFRDKLDHVIAARWDDIQAVLEDYQISSLPLLKPDTRTREPRPDELRAGLIVPAANRAVNQLSAVGEAARRGAAVAEGVWGRSAGANRFRVLLAEGPTDAATVRAAERLAATEDVHILIGGFGDGQASELADFAAEAAIVFFNIAATADSLRNPASFPNVLSIQSAAADLIAATLAWHVADGAENWFVFSEASPEGKALMEDASSWFRDNSVPGTLLGMTAVDPGHFAYTRLIREAEEQGAESILLLLSPEAQEMFLAQVGNQSTILRVAGIAHPRTQTRDWLLRYRDASTDLGSGVRIVDWDGALSEGAAGEVNNRYVSRMGQPLESVGWTAYTAVLLAAAAAEGEAERTADALLEFFLRDDFEIDTGKGQLSFSSLTHQLEQPLYAVQAAANAIWTMTDVTSTEWAVPIGIVDCREGACTVDRF